MSLSWTIEEVAMPSFMMWTGVFGTSRKTQILLCSRSQNCAVLHEFMLRPVSDNVNLLLLFSGEQSV